MSSPQRARLTFALVFGLGGLAILIGLGVWQVQRLEWKLGIIERLEARLDAEPVALPESPTEAEDEYLRVSVAGRYGEEEIHVLTSLKPWGPGYRVVAPFETEGGRRILVDRGFIPQEEKGEDRAAPQAAVTGALLWPDETDSFTPAPDRAENIWFARDLPAMAEALAAEPALIVAESNPGERPVATPLTVNIRNDHLEYAITWFGLAAVWAAMTVALVRRIVKRGRI
ncbi:MAG: SURF1 family protein [Pseudomonadota bacterium]